MVGQSKKIINANMIELSQSDKNLRRDHSFAAFIVSIGPLRDIDLLANFSLSEVRIFS